MTLLDKMAEAVGERLKSHALDRDPLEPRELVKVVLSALQPTQALLNRMGAKAFDGPQEVGDTRIYPAQMLRAAVRFIVDEEDREPEEEPETEAEEGTQ